VGITAIYVTHDQVEAMGMGDRIAVMNRGRVCQLGRPRDVYSDPADTFVAGFLGSPPMNLVDTGERMLGFRPECFLPREMYDKSVDVVSFRFNVTRVEDLGADHLVYGNLDERFNRCHVVSNLPTSFACYCVQTGCGYDFAVPRDAVKYFATKPGLRTEPSRL